MAETEVPEKPSAVDEMIDDAKDDEYYSGNAEDDHSSLLKNELILLPNDFNIATTIYFMDKGRIRIPSFQRHFQWDLKKSSLFIDTILCGLPMPSFFFQENKEGENRFKILDGQQRLLTIYFFVKGRYPKNNDRIREQIRSVMIDDSISMKEMFMNDDLFVNFKLNLPKGHSNNKENKFNGMSYKDIEDDDREQKENFDFTTLHIINIKKRNNRDGDNGIFEIYKRLNSGGVNLAAQQIRAAMYDSEFYKILYKLNKNPAWRSIVGKEYPNKKMYDIEALLRAIALLVWIDNYKGGMKTFLNNFSCNFLDKTDKEKEIKLIEDICLVFFKKASGKTFLKKNMNKFSVPTFESVFLAICEEAWKKQSASKVKDIDSKKLNTFLNNSSLEDYLQEGTTNANNIQKRLTLAKKTLL